MITFVEVQVYFLSEEEGGRSIPFGVGFSPKIQLDGSPDILFTELELEDDEVLYPGDNVKITMKIKGDAGFYLHRGASFDLIEGEVRIGTGSVMKILN